MNRPDLATVLEPGSRETSAADAIARLAGALLALAVAAVHVADQGGVTALGSPHWMGWSFRFIEVAGVLSPGPRTTLMKCSGDRNGLTSADAHH